MKRLLLAGLLCVPAVFGLDLAPQGPVPPGGAGLPPVVGPPAGGGARPGGGRFAPPRRGGGGGGGARGGAAPAAGKAPSPDPTQGADWEDWWDLNDDAYTWPRARARAEARATSAGDSLLGKDSGEAVTPVDRAALRGEILPALLQAASDADVAVRRQTAHALGKVADAGDRDAETALRRLVGDTNWEVRTAAVLALGTLGSVEALPLLRGIMADAQDVRDRIGLKGSFTPRERAFAALGVGLVGLESGVDPETIDDLRRMVKAESAHPDLRVFPALALGIMKAHAATPDLTGLAFDSKSAESVRAHAVTALAKLGAGGAVSRIIEDGLDNRSGHVRRSAALALGVLGTREDSRVAKALAACAGSAPDRSSRDFALIAMGQLGHASAPELLAGHVQGGHVHDRTFGALALGVYASSADPGSQKIGRALMTAFRSAKSDSERAAFAVALGLADFKPAAEVLRAAMKEGSSPHLRGYYATALGLLGDKDAIAILTSTVKETPDGALLHKAAVALGMIGDPAVVPTLVAVFKSARGNHAALAGAILALGILGDAGAVAPLVAVLSDPGAATSSRAYAAMALGILGDKRSPRSLLAVQRDLNYLATTEWLPELLVLN